MESVFFKADQSCLLNLDLLTEKVTSWPTKWTHQPYLHSRGEASPARIYLIVKLEDKKTTFAEKIKASDELFIQMKIQFLDIKQIDDTTTFEI